MEKVSTVSYKYDSCLGGCYFGDGLGLTLVKLVVRMTIASGVQGPAYPKNDELPKSLAFLVRMVYHILFGDGPIWTLQVMALAHCPLGNIFL